MTTEHEPYSHKRRRHGSKANKAGQRRDFLRLVPWALVGVSGAGAAIYSLTKDRGIPASAFPEVLSYYPEMNEEKLKDQFSFTTQQGKNKVGVFNFTNTRVDRDSTRQVFDFMEQIPLHGTTTTLFQDGITIESSVLSGPPEGMVNVFVIDKSSPPPAWAPQLGAGATNRRLGVEKWISNIVIRTNQPMGKMEQTLYENEINMANAIFFTEACQALLYVNPNIPQYQTLVQEAFCNTTSNALIARVMGRPHYQYSEAQSKFTYSFPSLPGQKTRYREFLEEEYYQLPILPSVFIQN
jgi:hypothetical protein